MQIVWFQEDVQFYFAFAIGTGIAKEAIRMAPVG
jgi:hypothetical protein